MVIKLLNPIRDGLFRGCSRMGDKKTHISCNETWRSYTLPKEDLKNI